MSLTKEQFQTFDQHFKIMETTLETVESTTNLNFENFDKYQDNPSEFFLETDWIQHSAEVTSSEGYYIQYKPTDDVVKSITDINDVADFIENDMETYLAEHNQKDQPMNNTIDILFERLNTPRAIFDEVATRTNLIPVAEELKDHPDDMKAIINAFHNYEYFDNMGSIVKNLGLKDKYPKTYQFFCELSGEEVMDGDYSIKSEYYPPGISDLQEWLSKRLTDACINSPYVKDPNKYAPFAYSCYLTSTDEEGGFDNDGLFVSILNGEHYDYFTIDETELCLVRNTYDIIKTIDNICKAKPLETTTLTTGTLTYYNILVDLVSKGEALADFEIDTLKRELKKGN